MIFYSLLSIYNKLFSKQFYHGEKHIDKLDIAGVGRVAHGLQGAGLQAWRELESSSNLLPASTDYRGETSRSIQQVGATKTAFVK